MLEECKTAFEQALKERDKPALRELNHKMYPTLSILSASQLLEEFEKGKVLLSGAPKDEDIAASIRRMTEHCERLTEELKKLPV
jgi:TATA-box binding protein (TBP) (component of TFIID and TFIIIB)